MKIYLDSAQIDSWKLPAGCPAIQGVTTNPSLVFQAGLPVNLATYLQLIQAAADHGMAELMLQLPTNDATLALQWLDQLRAAAENVNVRLTIKLPCHPDWLPTISAVQAKGQAILLTGLSNPVQLLWAKSLKAAFVAPYVGRLVADGRDVWPFLQACVAVQNEPDKSIGGDKKGPALLAASIKSTEVLTRLIATGAAAVTLPPASLVAWSGDALTEAAMDQFELDTSKSLQFTP
ncbi:MAG: Fructose-6-phosphate aldolase 1 [Pseudomonadota bacterium]|jgi:transaldolase